MYAQEGDVNAYVEQGYISFLEPSLQEYPSEIGIQTILKVPALLPFTYVHVYSLAPAELQMPLY